MPFDVQDVNCSGFRAHLTSKAQEEEEDCSCADNRPIKKPTGYMKIGN
jgi:hypothetical protein